MTRIVARLMMALLLVPQIPREQSIRSLGRFVAESGYFFQSGTGFDIYDAESSVRTKVAVLLNYTHDRYEYVGGSWKRVLHRPSDGPRNYLDLGPCDWMNQIDFGAVYSDVQALVPNSKIKDVFELNPTVAKSSALVLYTSGKEGNLKINVALVKKNSGKAEKLVDTEEIDGEYYCGYRVVPVPGKAKHRALLFVYSNEPGGSGDEEVIDTYLLKF